MTAYQQQHQHQQQQQHHHHPRRLTSHFGFQAAITTIPYYDICRLCFYLKCCLLGCEMIIVNKETTPPQMMIVDPRIIDYNNAYKLSSADQFYILHLCLGEYNIDKFINKKIFIDSSDQEQTLSLLPPETANSFFEVLQEEVVEEEEEEHTMTTARRRRLVVNKVMVCTAQWVQDYYEKPVNGLLESFKNIPTILPSPIRQLILHYQQQHDETEAATTMFLNNHCIHCRGMSGHCTCEEGCLPGPNSCCTPIHRGFVCHECPPPTSTSTTTTTRRSEYITGPRYSCLTCNSRSSDDPMSGIVLRGGGEDNECNLCHTCYNSVCCEHDQTHEFELINRPGEQPRRLLPKGFVFNKNEKKGGNNASSSSSSSNKSLLEGNEIFQEFLHGVPTASAIKIETATAVKDDDNCEHI